jgi:RNA polymerase sigma factor (sigma-70 family)
MPSPPTEQYARGLLLGAALRAQPDRRLVRLVRAGYEVAFEEIVRRYRKPLNRFAAAIVGPRSEDVTQDAFSKALLALRGSEQEIELRPWLYRIVRNTALNDLRDSPPAAEQLAESIQGGASAALEAERREELAELTRRLRALPEPQRAAIVMRELEGLSHEEIAAALGVSGGAARQAIYRARAALRDGLGLLVPLPLARLLLEHGSEAAAGGVGTALGGLGAGGAVKAGLATALIAGVGAGVAIQDRDGGGGFEPAAAPSSAGPVSPGDASPGGSSSGPGPGETQGDEDRGSSGPGGGGEDRSGSDRGSSEDSGERDGSGESEDIAGHREDRSGHVEDRSSSSGPSGSGSSGSGHGGSSESDGSGPSTSGGEGSG